MSDPSKNHAGVSRRHVLIGGAGLAAAAQVNGYGSIWCKSRAVARRLAGGIAVSVNDAGHAMAAEETIAEINDEHNNVQRG
jgi:hypothetical protein